MKTFKSPFFCAGACMVIFLCASAHAARAPRVFQTNPDYLLQMRAKWQSHNSSTSQSLGELVREAKKDLTAGPYSVVDQNRKHPLPGVDPHEYVSLGRYDWPNPKTKNGLPYIRRDGVSNPEIADYDVELLGDLSKDVYTLSLAGYITGERKYSDRAAELLRVFFLDPATRMNPNFEHAQMIPGVNEGRHAGMIESRRFLNVIDAIGLLEASDSSWSKKDDQEIRQWFSQFVDWMQTGKFRDESDKENNHGTWYDVQVVTFRLFLGDKDQAKKILEAAKKKRIAIPIKPNGDEPEELVRTKSLSYSVFNLEALTNLADLGQRAGVDLWHYKTPDGRCIRLVIDSLIPYATGQKKWPHQQIAHFDPKSMAPPLERAAVAYHDPHYAAIARQLRGDATRDNLTTGAQF